MNLEERYDIFFDKAPIGAAICEIIYGLDGEVKDFHIQDSNLALLESLCVESKIQLKDKIESTLIKGDFQLIDILDRIDNHKIPFTFEAEYDVFNDCKFYCEITVYSLNKGFIGLLMCNRTYLRLKENGLEKTIEYYKKIIEQSPVLTIILDKNSNIEYINHASNRLLGISQSELNLYRKRNFKDLPCFRFNKPDEYLDKISAGIDVYIEDLYVRKSESSDAGYISVRTSPVFIGGEFNSTIAVIEDVTFKKVLEKNIENCLFENTLIMDNVDAQIWTMKSPNVYGVANKSHCEFFGHNKTEFHNGAVLNLIAEADEFITTYHMAWQKKIPVFAEKYCFNKNGNKRILSIKATPIYDEDYNVNYLICSGRDITEERRNEEEMKRLIVALRISNKLTDERASEIMELNKQLADSEVILKGLIASKDRFFSIIAHDLKSPFQGFLSLTKYLANNISEMLPDDIAELATAMNDSASNLFKLLDNLLSWSRIQRGAFEYNPELIDLRLIVEMNFSIIYPNASAKKVKLVNNIPESFQVFSDLNIINTVIRNLLSNAIKFSNFGQTIKVGMQLINDNFTEVFVKDEGVGMSKQTIDELFKIDGHKSSPGTANESGTGLGLILCKDLLTINGGAIRVESKQEEGSTFFFTIPRAKRNLDDLPNME